MTDRELADMIVASAGYRLFAGPTDKAKVTAAAGGVRKPSPSNREARVAWELYLRDTQPAPQPGPSPLAAIWQRDAIFTSGGLSNFAGATRDRAKATGWHVVYVQLANIAAYQDANEAELPAFLAQGWTLVGWGTYGQGTDPEEDGYCRWAGRCCRATPRTTPANTTTAPRSPSQGPTLTCRCTGPPIPATRWVLRTGCSTKPRCPVTVAP